MSTPQSEESLRRQIVEFGRRMYQRGYVAANDGNLSVRLPGGGFLATPTGVSKGFMSEQELVILDAQGEPRGSGRVSTEIKMHLAVYRARPDVGGVVHAHPPVSTAFSLSATPLNPHLLPEVIVSLGAIPVAEYCTPSTQDLADTVQQYILDHNAVLMANHGAITVGEDLARAYFRLETLEHFATINFLAYLLGGVRPLPEKEVAKLLGMREFYGQKQAPVAKPALPASNLEDERLRLVSSVVAKVLSKLAPPHSEQREANRAGGLS